MCGCDQGQPQKLEALEGEVLRGYGQGVWQKLGAQEGVVLRGS